MKKPGNPSAGQQVSASELAQMGVCERLVVFEQCYGKRRTLAQRRAIRRGQRAHLRFYRERHLDALVNVISSVTGPVIWVLYAWLRRALRIVLWPLLRCIAWWARAVEGSDDP